MCVIAMPAKELSPWWRGKHGFQVGTSLRLESAASVKSGISAQSSSACTGWLMDVKGFPVSVSEMVFVGNCLLNSLRSKSLHNTHQVAVTEPPLWKYSS